MSDEQLLKDAAQNARALVDAEMLVLAAQISADLPITPPTTDESLTLRTETTEYVLGHLWVRTSYYEDGLEA